MPSSVSSYLYTFQMHFKDLECQVSHFDAEASPLREGGLLEGNLASKCGFKSTTHAAFNVIDHEALE